MKAILLLFYFLILSTSCFAEWSFVSKSVSGIDFYIDKASITKKIILFLFGIFRIEKVLINGDQNLFQCIIKQTVQQVNTEF